MYGEYLKCLTILYMKQLYLFLFLLFAANVNAQLRVDSIGQVSVMRSTLLPNIMLGVGPQYANVFNSMNVGVHSYISNRNTFNLALMGAAELSTSTTSNRGCGVYGSASNYANGYNYGVFGILKGSNNGAGVFGSANNSYPWGCDTGGKYAGFFYGDVYVTNQITAASYLSLSDMRLKENVELLAEKESDENTLDRLLSLNVISFNYKCEQGLNNEGVDPAWLTAQDDEYINSKLRHFGFSAQELQTVYPELVCEGQDGYLRVNYVELVPLLIRSIQELKKELDEVKGNGKTISRSVNSQSNTLNATTTGNILYQNTPNPYNGRTIIRFQLVDDAKDASICVFDMNGKMLKKIPVSLEMDSISVDGSEFGEGMYLYSLIVNGQVIDTKRMVITM